MNLALWLERAGKRFGARPALFHGTDLVMDYQSFAAQAAAIAAGLKARGIKPGDRVALFAKNAPDYLPLAYGIWWAGAVAVLINNKLHQKEAAWITENAEASLAIADCDLGCEMLGHADGGWRVLLDDGAETAPVPRKEDDLAWLFYTSGTTGRPKGVMITHGMARAMALSYFADVDEVLPEDAAIYAAPLSHGAGIYNFMHVLRGSAHVIPQSGGFDPREIFDLAAHFKSAHLFAAPTMVHRLCDVAEAGGLTGEGLRSVIYAGGPMYVADIMRAVDLMGPRFIQVYGQGECPMSITALTRQEVADRSHPRWKERLGSVGRAQSIVEVQIGTAEGTVLPHGQVGEIMVRGAAVMPGYWKNEKATAETLVNGWLMTGDMGHMDEDGYVTMVDRSKDMIISGGSNVYPREVEEVLLTHPSVREVAVVGEPDPEWGENIVAFIVTDGRCDTEELDAHCLAQIARFKRPKRYEMVAELPKNNYGKVLKTELRAKFSEVD